MDLRLCFFKVIYAERVNMTHPHPHPHTRVHTHKKPKNDENNKNGRSKINLMSSEHLDEYK